jgi:hypothetical protein
MNYKGVAPKHKEKNVEKNSSYEKNLRNYIIQRGGGILV